MGAMVGLPVRSDAIHPAFPSPLLRTVGAMTYRRSLPLERWCGERRAAIDVLAQAHAELGEVSRRRGRPLEIGRPAAHAYLLRVVAEFQGFVRDLHDLASDKLVEMSGPDVRFQSLLVAAATEGRRIDRGNADLGSIRYDFMRIGLADLDPRIARHNGYWNAGSRRRGDKAYYGELIELRNALAHGNQRQLDGLRRRGVRDTVTWARSRLAGVDRFACALDRAVWDHLRETFGTEPW